MFGRGFRIATIRGVPVNVDSSWIWIAVLLVATFWSQLDREFQDLSGPEAFGYAVFGALVFFGSVFLHEAAHAITARANGIAVHGITLVFFGGFTAARADEKGPGPAFAIAALGPGTSLGLAGVFWVLARLLETTSGPLPGLFSYVSWVNLFMAVFNALPGLPLDGGRMLRAVIWKLTGRQSTATIAAAWAGRVLAVSLFVVPFVAGAVNGTGGDLVSVLWLAVIAVFMWTGAGQAIKATRFRERLPALQARRLARKAVSVTADTPVAEAIRRAEENQARAVVIVDHEDKPIAILNETAVMATPEQRRPWLEAGTLARTLEPSLVLSADLSGLALLEAIRRAPAPEYLLVEPSGQVYGVLAARDVDHAFAGV